MNETNIKITERNDNIPPEKSILAKGDTLKYRKDLPYYDKKGRIWDIEVEFSYPADNHSAIETILALFTSSYISKSKEALKHWVEQFCFNHPGIEARYTGYEDIEGQSNSLCSAGLGDIYKGHWNLRQWLEGTSKF